MSDLKKVQSIHHATGASIADCRAALADGGGDVASAVELLKRKVDPALLAQFDEQDWFTGPRLTTAAVLTVEAVLGLKLPPAYVALLLQKNGGVPVNTCFPVDRPTSWADNYIEITGIRGIGGKHGINVADEADIHASWGYPPGLVFAETPTAGHTVVMFNYAHCGPSGEPSVVWVDMYGDTATVIPLAPDFTSFLHGLVHADEFE